MPQRSRSDFCKLAIQSFPCKEISLNSSSSGLKPVLITPPSTMLKGGESITVLSIASTMFSNSLKFSLNVIRVLLSEGNSTSLINGILLSEVLTCTISLGFDLPVHILEIRRSRSPISLSSRSIFFLRSFFLNSSSTAF